MTDLPADHRKTIAKLMTAAHVKGSRQGFTRAVSMILKAMSCSDGGAGGSLIQPPQYGVRKKRKGKRKKRRAVGVVKKAKYQGKTVTLNKPFRTPGGKKKFAVYVTNAAGKVVVVRFGDPNMEIRRDDPGRRKNFRARHNCAGQKDRTKPAYWSCRMWAKKPVSKLAKAFGLTACEYAAYKKAVAEESLDTPEAVRRYAKDWENKPLKAFADHKKQHACGCEQRGVIDRLADALAA